MYQRSDNFPFFCKVAFLHIPLIYNYLLFFNFPFRSLFVPMGNSIFRLPRPETSTALICKPSERVASGIAAFLPVASGSGSVAEMIIK